MKKLVFRILAFAIDILFINILLIGLSNISFINPNISNINKTSAEFSEITKEYNGITSRLDEMFYDNYIDISESTEIKGEYKHFVFAFYDIPINQEIDSSVKDRVVSDINTEYQASYELYNAKINKYNMGINIISIIISILYFGVLEWHLNGQTIGKKIFRLRTVDNKDMKNKIPLWKYIIKAILIGEVLFTLANVICSAMVNVSFEGSYNADWYHKSYMMIYNLQYIYNTLFLLIIFIRKDERSVHDILLNIRVALFDKNNKEVKSRIFNEESNNKTN